MKDLDHEYIFVKDNFNCLYFPHFVAAELTMGRGRIIQQTNNLLSRLALYKENLYKLNLFQPSAVFLRGERKVYT